MKDKLVVEQSGGIGFLGILTLIFITLKLVGIGPVATWSWLWVVSPIWIPIALVFVVVTLIVLFS